MSMTELVLLLGLVAGLQIAAAASPGPNFILITSYATTKTVGQALKATIGIVLGILVWSTLTALGLGALISSSPRVYGIIQYLGAAYLIWLGTKMILSTLSATKDAEIKYNNRPGDKPIMKGFWVNIGNPKTIAYYTSLFAVLIPSDAPVWLLGAVVATDVIACGAWWVFVAFLFSSTAVKGFFVRSQRYLDRLFGTALILLGLKLALDRS